MKEKLLSRKLWVAAMAAFLVSLGTNLGIDPDSVQNIVYLAMSYILGQGAVDAAEKLKV